MKNEQTPIENEFSADLGAMLRAYEGPGHVRRRSNRAWIRPRLLAMPIAALAICAVGAAIVAADLMSRPEPVTAPALRHVVLPTLSPGPSKISSDRAASASMIYEPLEHAIQDAELVFVGRVVAIGPKEYVTEPSSLDPAGMIMYRVRYRVERVFRGDPVDTIDLGDWAVAEGGSSSIDESTSGVFPAEVGLRYLVFAEWRRLGERRVLIRTPYGYFQNIYLVTDEDTAMNESNGAVHFDELEKRIAAAETSRH